MRSVLLGIFLISAVSVSAQTASKIPRAPDGHPDLQGTWDFAQLTPFERPGAFSGKSSLSDEEAEEFAQQRIETGNKDNRGGGAAADVERAYNDFWWDFGKRVAKQTSLVVDPPDGRVPALTPEAQKRAADRRGKYDNPEERPLAERCVLGFNSGPPMIPSAVQQQHATGADPRSRDHPERDDPQREDRPARRSSACARAHPIAHRRFGRPLGGRYAGGRYDELLAGGRLQGRLVANAPGGALLARGQGHAAL